MLLNRETIESQLIQKDSWAETHGVIDKLGYLGTSVLYFALAYMLPAKNSVILGSGSGFVPRLVRQAQREVFDPEFLSSSRCILIDACKNDKGFGDPDYHENPLHFFRTSYPDVEIWKMTTDEGAAKLVRENIAIDYLHIDADHTFEQSLKDFENYLPLMAPEFIITLHDTAANHLDNYMDGCVARTVAHLRSEMAPGGKYEHLEMVNFNNRNRNWQNHFKCALRCRGTALIAPKTFTAWDTGLGGFLCGNGHILP